MTEPIHQAVLNKARQDKFTFVLNIPNILKKLNTNNIREDKLLSLDSMQFSVYNVTVPNVKVPEIPVPFGGQNYNISSYNRPPYPPCKMNFEVDNEYKNYWVMWKWLELMNDPQDSVYAGKTILPEGYAKTKAQGYYDYQTDFNLFVKDEYNKPKTEFIFKNAFITHLGELELNYREQDQLSCSFEFVFNRLEIHIL